MEVDSDKSFVCDRGSLHYGCSPDLGTAASTTKVCTIGENSKRKVSPADFEYQSLSTNRGKDGPDEGSSENPDRPRKRRKGDPSLPYACPYFINSPDEYPGCAKWQKKELHRVKEHVKRTHLKPVQCNRCSVFRAGDNGQIKTHLRDGDCQRAAFLVPVESDIVAKGKALERRAMSWEQIYETLFPGCGGSDIPSPNLQDCVDLPTVSTQGHGSSPIGAYVGAPFDEPTNEHPRNQKPMKPSVGHLGSSPLGKNTQSIFHKRTNGYPEHHIREVDHTHGSFPLRTHTGSISGKRASQYPQNQMPKTPSMSHEPSPIRAHIGGAFSGRTGGYRYPQSSTPRMPTVGFGHSPFGTHTRDPFGEGMNGGLGGFAGDSQNNMSKIIANYLQENVPRMVAEYLQDNMPGMVERLCRGCLRGLGPRNQPSLSSLSLDDIQTGPLRPSPVSTHHHGNHLQDLSPKQETFHQLDPEKDHLRTNLGQSQAGGVIRSESQERQTVTSPLVHPLMVQHSSSILGGFVSPQHRQQSGQGPPGIAQTHPLVPEHQPTVTNLDQNEDSPAHFGNYTYDEAEDSAGDSNMDVDHAITVSWSGDISNHVWDFLKESAA